MAEIRQAVFPVAGLGQRLYPASRAAGSKELVALHGHPLIDYAVAEALSAGAERLVFIVPPEGEVLERYLAWDASSLAILERQGRQAALALARAQAGVEKIFIPQSHPLGLGDAVRLAEPVLDTAPFAVLLPDDVISASPLCLVQMAAAWQSGHMVAVEQILPEETARYGIIAPEQGAAGNYLSLSGLVEKPSPEKAPSSLAIIGRYILAPEIFMALSGLPSGAGGEIQLTDAIAARLRQDGVFGYRFEGERFDCGTLDGLALAATGSVFHPCLPAPH